jgi:hypothetical protein
MNITQIIYIYGGLILICSLNSYPQKFTIDFSSDDSSKGELILAETGDKKITIKEFIYSYEFGPSFPKKGKNSKEVYLNYLINEKLLAADGYSRKVDTLPIVKDYLYGIETDLATEELFKDEVMKEVKISDEEINAAIGKKLVSVELKWLYAPGKDSLLFFTKGISAGLPFDSLFRLQLNDSVFEDQRKWDTDLFNLENKSSMIAGLIKNQKVGSISSPVKGSDGWYIFKIDIWKEVLPNESEINQLKEKSGRALQKAQMDSLSDQYVKKIFIDQNPQIIWKTFDLLRTFLAKYEVNPDRFKEWRLDDKLNFLQLQIDSLKKDFYSLTLVEMKDGSYSFKDFIDWLRYRDQVIKFNEKDFNSFSVSIESYVWRMVRDNSLTKIAFSKGYQNNKSIREQLRWWEDKIVYTVVRDEIIGSALLGNNNNESFKYENKPLPDEANKKLLHKVLALKQKYKIKINKDLLSEIKVENENDPKAIDVYAVKKGGVFPRPAFPTIDILWQNWQ